MTECNTKWGKKWLKLDCHDEKIQAAATATEKFCGRWFRNNPRPGLMILAGDPNCGKTHLARKIASWSQAAAMKAFDDGLGKTWQKLPSVVYLRWPEVVDGFKEGSSGAMEDIINAGMAILDDIGSDLDPSGNATNKLCQILNRREKAFTVITTNVPPEKWSERFDGRICDRFLRNSDVVDLFGVKSYAFISDPTPTPREISQPYKD